MEEEELYVESDFDLIQRILSEQQEKAFKYDCLVKKIKDNIKELKEMKLECETFSSMRNYAILILQELLEERGKLC